MKSIPRGFAQKAELEKLVLATEIQARIIPNTLLNYLLMIIFAGGPLFAPAEVETKVKFIQYGVISSGVACEEPDTNYPGIFTNVGLYMKWILDSMQEN